MGQAKREHEEHLEEVAAAKDFLVEKGLLNYCDRHENFFDGCDLEDEELLEAAEEFSSAQNDSLNILREAIEESGTECGWCSKEDAS